MEHMCQASTYREETEKGCTKRNGCRCYRQRSPLFPSRQDTCIPGEGVPGDLEAQSGTPSSRSDPWREELRSMETISAEKPELLSMALVEFVS